MRNMVDVAAFIMRLPQRPLVLDLWVVMQSVQNFHVTL